MSSSREIDIRLAVPDDLEDILYGFRTYYWPYEPLSMGFKMQTASPIEEAFVMSIPQKGISLVATDVDRGNKLAGYLTIDVFTPQSLEKFEKFVGTQQDERLEAMKGIFMKLDGKCELFEKYKVDKVMLLAFLAVDPILRGQSIGTKLFRKAFELGKSHGFKVIATDCTSFYSQRIAENLGMELVGEVAYKEYVDANGEQIYNPPSIHTHMRRYVKLL